MKFFPAKNTKIGEPQANFFPCNTRKPKFTTIWLLLKIDNKTIEQQALWVILIVTFVLRK